jgi:hypothetical protein
VEKTNSSSIDGRRIAGTYSEADVRRAVHRLDVHSCADRLPGTLLTTSGGVTIARIPKAGLSQKSSIGRGAGHDCRAQTTHSGNRRHGLVAVRSSRCWRRHR